MSDEFVEIICNDCGNEFSEEWGLWEITDGVPCPECGSENTTETETFKDE